MRIDMPIVKLQIDLKEVKALIVAFQRDRRQALIKLSGELRDQVAHTVNRLMETEFDLFLGSDGQHENKRNGHTERQYALKGIGCFRVRVPRDRAGAFESSVVPRYERMDPRIREDIAVMQLAGLSTRTLSMMSQRLLGIEVGKDTVNESLDLIKGEAERWMKRPLGGKKYWALYVDGTNFKIRRRGTVEREPTLVVIGVGEDNCRSILAMEPGSREDKNAWGEVFRSMIHRGFDPQAVRIGIMDGLPGLEDVFKDFFPKAVTQRCWVHSKRNAVLKTSQRLRIAFTKLLFAVMYAESENDARTAFAMLKEAMGSDCSRAIGIIEKDLDSLLAHYRFSSRCWLSLKTTNPIERVNKEFKRRSKSMETMGDQAHVSLLTFTALRLEMGWRRSPVDSPQMQIVLKAAMERIFGKPEPGEKTVVTTNTLEQVVDELGLVH